jgi:hypothetical protein
MQYKSKLRLATVMIPFLFNGVLNAQAASSIQPTTIENESQDISIPMTQSNLDEEISVEQAQRERASQPTGAIEIGLSSYEPNGLQTVSRIADSSAFGLVGPPQINLNGVTPFGRNWNMKFGVGFLAMDRTGDLGAAGQTESDQQTAYLISGRVGGEYIPASLATTHFRPYLTGALLPSLVMTSRSAFDDGSSAFGVPIEVGAGTLVHILTSLDLNIAVTGTFGKIQDSNMNGLGLNAGVRFPL